MRLLSWEYNIQMIRAFDNLKERPHEERRTIAAIVAIAIVAALFLVWAILFFKKFQTESPAPVATTTAQAAASGNATVDLQQLFQ